MIHSQLDRLINDEVAILSWRWDDVQDTANPAQRSRNVFLAIDYAKKEGSSICSST